MMLITASGLLTAFEVPIADGHFLNGRYRMYVRGDGAAELVIV